MQINYVMRRYLHYGTREIISADLDDINDLLKKYKDDQMRSDIFMMQLQGIDPMKVSYYANWLGSAEKRVSDAKAHLNETDAMAYRDVFETVLKKVKSA